MKSSSNEANLKRVRLVCTALACIAIGSLTSPFFSGCNRNSVDSGQKRGPSWVIFNKAGKQLINNNVNALYEDRDGVIWIGTDSGAASFNHGYWNSVVSELSWTSSTTGGTTTLSSVLCITQGQDGSIWFGLGGGGIERYDQFGSAFTWKRYSMNDGIPWTHILSACRGQTAGSGQVSGEIWCASLYGIGRFIPSTNQGGQWESYTTSNTPTLPSDQVRSVAYNFNDNSIWFGAPQDAISYDENGVWTAIPLPAPYNLPITSIAFDAHNNAWFATWGGVSSRNVNTLEEHDYTHGNTNGKLPLGSVNAVTTDLDTIRWFGTNNGLIRFSGAATWKTLNRENTPNLPSDTVTALTYDLNGNLWIGTHNGVAVYNKAGTIF